MVGGWNSLGGWSSRLWFFYFMYPFFTFLYFYDTIFYSVWELIVVGIATVIWLVFTYFFVKKVRAFLKRAKVSEQKAKEKERQEKGPVLRN